LSTGTIAGVIVGVVGGVGFLVAMARCCDSRRKAALLKEYTKSTQRQAKKKWQADYLPAWLTRSPADLEKAEARSTRAQGLFAFAAAATASRRQALSSLADEVPSAVDALAKEKRAQPSRAHALREQLLQPQPSLDGSDGEEALAAAAAAAAAEAEAKLQRKAARAAKRAEREAAATSPEALAEKARRREKRAAKQAAAAAAAAEADAAAAAEAAAAEEAARLGKPKRKKKRTVVDDHIEDMSGPHAAALAAALNLS
jgi:hypothetical protein